MGTVFTQDPALLQQTHIIGFTSMEGTAGRLFTQAYKLEGRKANRFENWLDPNDDYAFVDFKQFNAASPGNNVSFYLSGATSG